MKLRGAQLVLLLATALVGAAFIHVCLRTMPVDAEIREVWMRREDYLGKSVRVSGTLKRFLKDLPKDHYALESTDRFRIGVEAPGLVDLVGRELTVEGTVVFDESKGLYLVSSSVDVR